MLCAREEESAAARSERGGRPLGASLYRSPFRSDERVMIKVGYLAALEQYQPQTALEHARNAARAGFDAIWATDHFHPWVHTGASAGFAWTWIASAAARVENATFGTAV